VAPFFGGVVVVGQRWLLSTVFVVMMFVVMIAVGCRQEYVVVMVGRDHVSANLRIR